MPSEIANRIAHDAVSAIPGRTQIGDTSVVRFSDLYLHFGEGATRDGVFISRFDPNNTEMVFANVRRAIAELIDEGVAAAKV